MEQTDPMKLSFYELDGKLYYICEGEVYTNDESGARVKVDMLPSSIQMYGECLDDPMFELLITEIKELGCNKALISAEDGSGLTFSFIEPDYANYKDRYRINEKGIYEIKGDLEYVEVTEDCEDGVTLEGDDAKQFFAWVGDEVEENATACIGAEDVAVYHACDDFSSTGRYNFYGIARKPGCLSVSEEIDEPDPEKNCGFDIALMNQFNKERPRFISADFEYPDYHKGEIKEGWAVKGILRLIALHGITNNVYEYGSNKTVSPEEKGFFDHDDEYFEDEDGNRWLEDDDDLDFEEEED